LVLLVENQGHLVRKEELIEKLWADAFVDEAAVSRCVWTIRNALGEDSKSQRFIQTVPKHGYKFVADVSEFRDSEWNGAAANNNGVSTTATLSTSADLVGASPADTAADDKVKLFLGTWRAYAVSAVAILAVGASIFYLTSVGSPVVGTGSVSIAVLPFKSLNTPDGDALYELGIAESLITKLSAIENFHVRSLGSVRRYAEIEIDPTAAGAEQKVEYVLASNYQVVDGKIRITAQLINVSAGKTVEAYDFLKDVPDTFAAQDAVAFELKDRLKAKFGNTEVGSSTARGTNNEEAYRLYLLAQNFNELRGPENGRVALEQIDKAVALDPNFARAWASKAYIHRYLGYGNVAIEHSLRSIEAVEKAIALDPDLSEAHSVRCFNKFRFEYNFDAAEQACKRAVELDPNSPLAHKLYSNFLYSRGRFDEAISEINKAIDLQPVSFDNQQTYALALYFARRYAESETQWKQLIPLNPNHNLIYGQLVKSLAQQGKETEAFEHLIKLLALEKADVETIGRFRTIYAKSGWPGVTSERIKIAEARGNARPYELARLFATVGDKNNAFKYLERAYQERSNMVAVVEVDPELDPLRDDPRYAELVHRIFDHKNGI
jgi:DNA-binding winged helix-turn-helix (wHTH) protein/TolB-like protein/Tfp pilus assembly protein PilF